MNRQQLAVIQCWIATVASAMPMAGRFVGIFAAAII